MAVTSAQVSVGAAAVALNPAETDTRGGTTLFVRNTNVAAADTIALGASGVTAGTGYVLAGGSAIGPFELSSGEQLFAIRGTAADATVHVLRLGS